MPRRLRTSKARYGVLTPDVLNRLTIGPEDGWTAADRDLWAAFRDQLLDMAHPGRRPEAWWHFECPRRDLRDLPDFTGTTDEILAAYDAFEERRRAYLLLEPSP